MGVDAYLKGDINRLRFSRFGRLNSNRYIFYGAAVVLFLDLMMGVEARGSRLWWRYSRTGTRESGCIYKPMIPPNIRQ